MLILILLRKLHLLKQLVHEKRLVWEVWTDLQMNTAGGRYGKSMLKGKRTWFRHHGLSNTGVHEQKITRLFSLDSVTQEPYHNGIINVFNAIVFKD